MNAQLICGKCLWSENARKNVGFESFLICDWLEIDKLQQALNQLVGESSSPLRDNNENYRLIEAETIDNLHTISNWDILLWKKIKSIHRG
jgi:hypothetical protein